MCAQREIIANFDGNFVMACFGGMIEVFMWSWKYLMMVFLWICYFLIAYRSFATINYIKLLIK
jgi:hypothetical protein